MMPPEPHEYETDAEYFQALDDYEALYQSLEAEYERGLEVNNQWEYEQYLDEREQGGEE